MRILLDTNVVLDLLLDRAPFAEAARRIVELHEEQRCNAYVSAITPVNVFYISRKQKDLVAARNAVGELLDVFHICPVDSSVLQNAFTLPFSDFEDAVQYAAAVASSLDAIVTRDTGDYKAAVLPVYSPTDFLNILLPTQQQ